MGSAGPAMNQVGQRAHIAVIRQGGIGVFRRWNSGCVMGGGRISSAGCGLAGHEPVVSGSRGLAICDHQSGDRSTTRLGVGGSVWDIKGRARTVYRTDNPPCERYIKLEGSLVMVVR